MVRSTEANKWTYLFDTVNATSVRETCDEHRQQLAEIIKRTRYFMANKAKVDAPHHRGTQEELGFRSFEGAAGGAVLIGETPKVPSLGQLFDWPDAHIHVPFDSTEVGAVIEELQKDPERVRRIRRNNVVNSLRRHDFAYRWQTILDAIGLPARPQLAQRIAKLNALADSIDRPDWPSDPR
jgi:hypothetical protein